MIYIIRISQPSNGGFKDREEGKRLVLTVMNFQGRVGWLRSGFDEGIIICVS